MDECMDVPTGEAPVVMLSDARGDLAESLGLIGYLGRALGVRSKRFALVVKDGVVQYKGVDEGSEIMETTSAEEVLKFLVSGKPSSSGGSLLPGLPPTWQLQVGAALVFLLWLLSNF